MTKPTQPEAIKMLKSARDLLSGLEGCSRNNFANLAAEEVDTIDKYLATIADEPAQPNVDAALLPAVLALDAAIHHVLIAGGDYGDELSDHDLRAGLKTAQCIAYRALISIGIEKIPGAVNPLRAFLPTDEIIIHAAPAIDPAQRIANLESELAAVNQNYQDLLAVHRVLKNALTQKTAIDAQKVRDDAEYGWLVENGKSGADLRYRTIEQGLPIWTEDNMQALRFARRQDADLFASEDDQAWGIVQHAWHKSPEPEWRSHVVRVCPNRDVECGNRPANWCATCPKSSPAHPVADHIGDANEMVPCVEIGCGSTTPGVHHPSCPEWEDKAAKNAARLVPLAIASIGAEHRRNILVEGFTPEHDDEHDCGALAAAGSAYALAAADLLSPYSQGDGGYDKYPPEMWPFVPSWWKPCDARRMLVKAGALIVAEIERIDRAAPPSTAKEQS